MKEKAKSMMVKLKAETNEHKAAAEEALQSQRATSEELVSVRAAQEAGSSDLVASHARELEERRAARCALVSVL